MTTIYTAADLKTYPGAGSITLLWVYDDPNRPAQLYFDLKAEVWAAPINDFSVADKIGEGIASFTHGGLNNQETRYYWTRAKAPDGTLGELFPRSPTGGVVGTALIATPPVKTTADAATTSAATANTAAATAAAAAAVANAFATTFLASSIGTNGYVKTSEGLIIQWGQDIFNGSTITYPIAFPNNIFIVVALPTNPAVLRAPILSADSFGAGQLTGFKGIAQDAAGASVAWGSAWLAIGK